MKSMKRAMVLAAVLCGVVWFGSALVFAAGEWVEQPGFVDPAVREYTATGLVPGDGVTIKVVAENPIGARGPESDPAAEVLMVGPVWGERPVPGWSGVVKVGTSLTWTWGAATGPVAGYKVILSKWKPAVLGCGKPAAPALK